MLTWRDFCANVGRWQPWIRKRQYGPFPPPLTWRISFPSAIRPACCGRRNGRCDCASCWPGRNNSRPRNFRPWASTARCFLIHGLVMNMNCGNFPLPPTSPELYWGSNMNAQNEWQIWGMVHSGDRWLQTYQGGRKVPPELPPVPVIHLSGPGRLAVLRGMYHLGQPDRRPYHHS